MTGFDKFYDNYPRKEAKLAAMKAWDQVTKQFDPEDIISGLLAQADMLAAKPRKFVPLPASWLRAGRWMDELEEPQTKDANNRSYDTWSDQEKEDCRQNLLKFGIDRGCRMFRYRRDHIKGLRADGYFLPTEARTEDAGHG